jgi:hypothetical protein
LPGALDAIRLGLVSGGVGTLIYAVVQAGGDLDEAGTAVVFLVVLVGLVLVVVSGWEGPLPEQGKFRPIVMTS